MDDRCSSNLRFADDIDLLADTREKLQDLTSRVDRSSRRMGLKINAAKTKTTMIGKQHEDLRVTMGGQTLEQVTKFVYLGGMMTEDD